MPAIRQRITPFLWFDDQAEQAATFYCAIFPDSRIDLVARYTKEAAQATGREAGSAMTVEFVLDGQHFTALNGGPHFQFNEAVSLVVHCASQEEVDHYWNGLGEGADPGAQQCGWLKDRFGLTWQVVPDELIALLNDPDPERGRRTMIEMMKMKKIDIASLRRAADGTD
ncbi:MAG TPA: VOC family protein [Xanthomonadaceae bacterium]|jgi:predicted 3-demethylubiquinone-9 3-methyltransferase (glyoxalase superfamily)